MTVVHKITADLNGTGIMVDITDRVDMTAGLAFSWGRTDWAAAEPIPGTLSLTLDNWDGALTPGSPTNVYLVGPALGCAVYWDRREAGAAGGTFMFTMGPPEITFPNGASGSSKITVQCVDVLARLAMRIQRSMYDETVLQSIWDVPAAYWPCNETSGAAAAADQSGRGGPPLTAVGAVGWAAAAGPPAGNDPTVYLQSGVTDLTKATRFGTYLSTDGEVDCDTDPGGSVAYPLWTLELWATANNAPRLTPDDVLILAEVVLDNGAAIILAGRPDATGATLQLGVMTSLIPGPFVPLPGRIISTVATYFLSLQMWFSASAWNVDLSIDNAPSSAVAIGGLSTLPRGNRPVAVTIGSAPASRPFVYSGGVYDWIGAVGKICLYPAAPLESTNRWQIGAVAVDDELDRFLRLAGYSGLNLLYGTTTLGAPLPDLLEIQDTAGENMLTSMATALAEDRSQIFAAPWTSTIPSALVAPRLQAVVGSAAANYLPALTVDVEGQAVGVPPMTKDATGRVSSATATSRNLTAAYTDPALLAQIGPVSASVKTALSDPAGLARVAQDRVVRGHTATAVAQQITVDLATSPPPAGGWMATLIALVPGSRIRLSGLPANVLGYGQVDQYLIGGAEVWTAEQQQVTLNLTAADAPAVGYTAPETSGLLPGLPDTYWRTSGDVTVSTAMTAVQTWLNAENPAALAPFTTDAADYPLLLRVGQECVQAVAPPTVNSGGPTWGYHFATIVRGAATTLPRLHRVGEPVDVWLPPAVTI